MARYVDPDNLKVNYATPAEYSAANGSPKVLILTDAEWAAIKAEALKKGVVL